MMRRADAIAVLDELAALPVAETPAALDLLAACPALRTCEWVNRYGPADEWRSIALRYSTTALSRLIRVLVTAERELKWSGGSVAAPIWLFQAYQGRPDGDADHLAAWIFCHRGNDYLPFGRMTSARTVAEWRSQQEREPAHRAAHEERHRCLGDAKAQRLRERRERAEARRQEGPARKQQIESLLAEIAAMAPAERLVRLASDEAIPLGALPENLITPCLDAAVHLPAQTRFALARRIDHRQARHWKQLRQRLG